MNDIQIKPRRFRKSLNARSESIIESFQRTVTELEDVNYEAFIEMKKRREEIDKLQSEHGVLDDLTKKNRRIAGRIISIFELDNEEPVTDEEIKNED